MTRKQVMQVPRRPARLGGAAKQEICERIAEGETLARICLDPRLPSRATVRRALTRDPAFRARYAESCRLQAEHWAEEILEIVDAGAGDTDAEGRALPEKDLLARAKLRVDARKWLLARFAAGLGPTGDASQGEEEEDPEMLFRASDLSEAERATLRAILARRLDQQEAAEREAGREPEED